MPRKKPTPDPEKDVIKRFKAHCEAGWSPRSFASQMKGGQKEYNRLRKTSPLFALIAQTFSQLRGRSVYTYLSKKDRPCGN